MILLQQETADWFPGPVHYSVRGELHSQVMFRLKSLKTSAVCWPENRTDSGGARSLEVHFTVRLAGGNILWFNHHYPTQTVSHSHFILLPLQDIRSVTGHQWNWITEQCVLLSLFIGDYISISFQDMVFLWDEQINNKLISSLTPAGSTALPSLLPLM